MRIAFALVVLAAPALALADAAITQRNFAGSVQLDYLAIATNHGARAEAFDGATVELSLKLAMDFRDDVTSNVKICVACHGLEVAMAFFDIRVADELNFRVGRFTPAFGSFPLRSDPANHLTSDKPLPYDMGRMLRFREWNEGILPAPWVDNGLEIDGTHFFGHGQLDYAVYAIGGPKSGADPVDFDYQLSRSPERYYIDDNSEPSVGSRESLTLDLGDSSLVTVGASAYAGRYDPDAHLWFVIGGADASLQIDRATLRLEYLVRRTEMSLGEDPAMRFKYGPGATGYDPWFLKEGWDAELEVPAGPRADLIARFDGLRRRGNVLASSPLTSGSRVLRYTAGVALRVRTGLRLKISSELYQFSDFPEELAFHVGLAGPF